MRTRAVRAFRGRNRRILQTLKRTLEQIHRFDQKATTAAAAAGVPAILFLTPETEGLAAAWENINDRVNDALAEKVSPTQVP